MWTPSPLFEQHMWAFGLGWLTGFAMLVLVLFIRFALRDRSAAPIAWVCAMIGSVLILIGIASLFWIFHVNKVINFPSAVALELLALCAAAAISLSSMRMKSPPEHTADAL
jgi:hypothetical protein